MCQGWNKPTYIWLSSIGQLVGKYTVPYDAMDTNPAIQCTIKKWKSLKMAEYIRINFNSTIKKCVPFNDRLFGNCFVRFGPFKETTLEFE